MSSQLAAALATCVPLAMGPFPSAVPWLQSKQLAQQRLQAPYILGISSRISFPLPLPMALGGERLAGRSPSWPPRGQEHYLKRVLGATCTPLQHWEAFRPWYAAAAFPALHYPTQLPRAAVPSLPVPRLNSNLTTLSLTSFVMLTLTLCLNSS